MIRSNETIFPSPTITYVGIAFDSSILICIFIEFIYNYLFNRGKITKTRALYYSCSVAFLSIDFVSSSLYYNSPEYSCLMYLCQRSAECLMPILLLLSYFVWNYDFIMYRAYGMDIEGLLKRKWQFIPVIICFVILIIQIVTICIVMDYHSPYDCTVCFFHFFHFLSSTKTIIYF